MSDGNEKVNIHASGGQEVSYRKSPLMRLTQILFPELGRETPLYVDPTMIVMARRVVNRIKDREDLEGVQCTQVILYGGLEVRVTESPDEIATRRDMSVGAR